MTAVQPALRITAPLWARAFIVLFLLAWVWIWATQVHGRPIAGWLAAAGGVLLGARMFVMGAVGSPDGRLTVRNQFSTRTFDRHELSDAVVDRANGPRGSGWAVFLVLADGSRHPVQITQAPLLRLFALRLERDADRLRRWIRDTH